MNCVPPVPFNPWGHMPAVVPRPVHSLMSLFVHFLSGHHFSSLQGSLADTEGCYFEMFDTHFLTSYSQTEDLFRGPPAFPTAFLFIYNLDFSCGLSIDYIVTISIMHGAIVR